MATLIPYNFKNAQMGKPGGTTTTTVFESDDIDVSLLDQTDSGTIDLSTENYGEIDGAIVVADRTDSSDVPLLTKTVGVVFAGVFDAANVTFDTITGDTADYLTLQKYSATPANSPLIAVWDSASTGIPVTPNGGDIIITWHANGIVRI